MARIVTTVLSLTSLEAANEVLKWQLVCCLMLLILLSLHPWKKLIPYLSRLLTGSDYM